LSFVQMSAHGIASFIVNDEAGTMSISNES
jgi:hypothetical protein